MDYVTVSFQPRQTPIHGRHITMRGLHGLLFNVLKAADPNRATWLHKHDSPKPFSMVPYYSERGHLAGLRYALLAEEATAFMLAAWQRVWRENDILNLGQQTFTVQNVDCIPGPDFLTLANRPAARELQLQFVSPTAFRQGPGHLPLPLPGNVFRWPLQVWQRYAPGPLQIEDDWLEWCGQNVFVKAHRIETAGVALDQRQTFTGFVGEVTFEAYQGTEQQLRIWQALGGLAAFSGVGHKTTMGMGAVETGGIRN